MRILSVLLAALLLTPVAASADITKADFPSKPVVKEVLDGSGKWSAFLAKDVRALGSKPAECRSDKQMLNFSEAKVRSYYGNQVDFPASVAAEAQIGVYHYPTAKGARKALKRVATYPERCPKVTEWVCTECDGVWTTKRTLATLPTVGKQSVAWTYRRIGNFKHTGYSIVARQGKLVVQVEVGRWQEPSDEPFKYPPLITDAVALELAQLALASATA